MVPIRSHARHWRTYFAYGGLVLIIGRWIYGPKRPTRYPEQYNATASRSSGDTTPEQQQEQDWRAATKELASRFVEQHKKHYDDNKSEASFNKKIGVIAIGITAFGSVLSAITLIVVSSQTGAAWEAVRDGKAVLKASQDAAIAAQGQLDQLRQQTETQRQLNKVILFVNFEQASLGGDVQPPTYEDHPGAGLSVIAGPTKDLINVDTVDLKITGTVKNFGNDPASLEGGDSWLLISSGLPNAPVYASPEKTADYSTSIPSPCGPHQIGEVSPSVIDKGQSFAFGTPIHLVERHSNDPMHIVRTIRSQLWTGAIRIFVYGRVSYTDQFGNRRAYGYGRVFNLRRSRWDKAGGNAYNYDREEDG